MELIDSHTHIDVDAYADDRAAVVARARRAGVTRQIVPAVTAAEWPNLARVCATHEGLHAGYGLHPVYLDAHRPEHLDALPGWLERERAYCVGECGLDFFVASLDRETQLGYLRPQLALARELELPVVLHARRAVEAILIELRRHPGITGVVHSYGGSEEQARQLVELGFMIGIGGPVTYERANRIRRVVEAIPIEHLLLETDSPDQPNASRRGERNEPANLVEVCQCIAAIRGVEPEVIAAATTANAKRLFDLA